VICDVTREEDICSAVKQAEVAFGAIDVLVNGAVLQIRKGLLDVSPEEIRRHWMLASAARCCSPSTWPAR